MWILMVFLFGPTTITHDSVEFSSERQCTKVKAVMEKRYNADRGNVRFRGFCAEK